MSQEKILLGKKLDFWATIASVAVLGLVVTMRYIKIDLGIDFSFLPPVYSTMNALCAVCLVFALLNIRKKNIETHRRWIYAAMTLSASFLLLYVLYHITTESVKYTGEFRLLYLLLLISHITLAALSFPFILFTFVRGFTRQDAAHKRLSRWVFWVWLYVAVTGPVCYLMLYGI
ncbi:MAG: hypothetical protein RL757_484 [Bacteroidota bacterium]|jgi:putative membrane protein